MNRYIVLLLACCCLIKVSSGMVKTDQFTETEHLANIYMHTKKSDLFSCCIEWGLQYMQENRPEKALEAFLCAEQKTTNSHIRAEALLHMGSIFYFGNGNIKPDYAKALSYFQDPAIQQPRKKSQKVACPKIRALAWFFMGNIYLRGDATVEKNLPTAEGYLKAAAEQNDEFCAKIEAQKILKELQGQCVIL